MTINLLEAGPLMSLSSGLVAVGLIIALFWPRHRPAPLSRLLTAPSALTSRPYLQAGVVLLLAVALRGLLLPVLGPPAPFYPDEFSIILQGETFAAGRLANATHPLYPFFETLYVSHVPSYASMYFPGRGLPLAIGNLLFGEAWGGVWLSMILLAVATVWMLRGWVSGGLALLGGILVVLRFGMLSGWINSYYGGGLIALGGVLVIGAFPRLMRAPRWRDSVALGLGLTLLMISRPFEGFMMTLPLLAWGGWSVLRRWREGERGAVVRTIAPTLLLTGAGAALLLAQNQAITGHMLRDPYTLNRATYAFAPAFLFAEAQRPTHPVPPALTDYYKGEAGSHARRHSVVGVLSSVEEKLKGFLRFYVGWAMLIPFFIGLYVARRQPILLLSMTLLMVGLFTLTWDWTQYAAPAFGLVMVLKMMGLDRLRQWQFRGRPSGAVLFVMLPATVVLTRLIPATLLWTDTPRPPTTPFTHACCAVTTETPRTEIIDRLRATPGQDLVLVRYRPSQPPWVTMVSNGPDIDRADIIWAHDLGPANQRLLDRYPDRKVWIVDRIGVLSAELTPLKR